MMAPPLGLTDPRLFQERADRPTLLPDRSLELFGTGQVLKNRGLGWALVCSPSTGPPFRITDAQIVEERSKPQEIVLHRPLEVFRLLA